MKHGDLVSVRWKPPGPRRVLCTALLVTENDIRHGINAGRPGLYLFRGYWYGYNPLDISSYGKIEGRFRRGKVVGRMRTHRQAKMLCI